jgi:SAM-dependent methyltransferase
VSSASDGSALRRFYDTHYAVLEGDDRSREMRLAFAMESLAGEAIPAGARILDVGCGVGNNLTRVSNGLHLDAPALIGVDISIEAVTQARSHGIDAHQLDVNCERLPFADGSIDAVLFLEVIEHLWNSDLIMEEVHRTLRNGGVLILTTPNLASWANRLALLLGFQPPSLEVSLRGGFGLPSGLRGNVGHIKSFTRRALLEYVSYWGFDVWKVGASVAGGTRGLIARLDRIVSEIEPLSSHTLLAARRASRQAPDPTSGSAAKPTGVDEDRERGRT